MLHIFCLEGGSDATYILSVDMQALNISREMGKWNEQKRKDRIDCCVMLHIFCLERENRWVFEKLRGW